MEPASIKWHIKVMCQGGVSIETHTLGLKEFHPDMKHVASIHVSLDKTCCMIIPNFNEA